MIQQGVSTDIDPSREVTIGRIMDYIEARLEAIRAREEEEDEEDNEDEDEEEEAGGSTGEGGVHGGVGYCDGFAPCACAWCASWYCCCWC